MTRIILAAAAAFAMTACSPGVEQPGGNVTATTNAAVADAPTITPVDGVAAAKWSKTVSVTPQGGYRMGNPDASVKLVEYGARTCPACAAFTAQAARPLEAYVAGGKVSYEFRDFAVHGVADVASAMVGRCGPPETFFPILEATYRQQPKSLDDLNKAIAAQKDAIAKYTVKQTLAFIGDKGHYVAIAESAGLPKGSAAACLADEAKAQALVDATNAAKDVKGTPSFQVNGRSVDSVSWPDVEKALKAAGA